MNLGSASQWPAIPAPQYEHTYDNHPALRTPSYKYNSIDKHWLVSKGRWLAITLLKLLYTVEFENLHS